MRHGKRISAGFGFRAAATPKSLHAALRATGYAGRVDVLACPADKTDGAMARFARDLGLCVIALPPDRIARMPTPTQSERSLAARGTGSVAEAAALAAFARAHLCAPRVFSDDRMATCAIAMED